MGNARSDLEQPAAASWAYLLSGRLSSQSCFLSCAQGFQLSQVRGFTEKFFRSLTLCIMTSPSLPLLPPKPHFIHLPGELGSVVEMALTPLPFHKVKLHLCLYSVVHSSPIPVSPKLEITQMPINDGMVKSIIKYSPSEILDSSESEPSTTTCNKLDEPQDHDVD